MNKMEVEIYIGFAYSGGSGGDWTTDYITVPDLLYGKDDLINDYISRWIDENSKEYEGLVFWGIYNIPPLEEEEYDD
jgi:hypothetical protein